MEPLRVVGRAVHDLCGSFLARALVTREPWLDLVAVALQRAGEDIPVLDRHHRALRKERQRRMAGVAEQARAADETVTVEGVVTLDGKPLSGSRIFFHVGDGQFVGAKIGDDGKYKTKLVPVGKHKVTIEYLKETPGGKVEQILPAKYAADDKGSLVVEVTKTGPNTLDFALKSK